MSAGEESVATFVSGGKTLFGIMHQPERSAPGVAILILVGGPQYRVGSHRMFVQIARDLCRSGYPVLRFDFAGMGDSEGDFAGFERLDSDVKSALDRLGSLCPSASRFVLLGLCDGATAAALYSPTDPRLAGVVLLNPWVHTVSGEAKAYLWHYYPRRVLQLDFWRKFVGGNLSFDASMRDFARKLLRILVPSRARDPQPASQHFIARMRDALSRFQGRVLVVTSGNDLTAAEFLALLGGDSSWSRIRESVDHVPLAGADHTLSSSKDLQKCLAAVADWLKTEDRATRSSAAPVH